MTATSVLDEPAQPPTEFVPTPKLNSVAAANLVAVVGLAASDDLPVELVGALGNGQACRSHRGIAARGSLHCSSLDPARPSPMAIVGLLCWMMVTSAVSGAPWPSLAGVTNRHTSVLFFAGGAGLWAIGAVTAGRLRQMLGWAFVAGAAASGLVGTIQLLAWPDNPLFGLDFGRPTGLAGAAPFLGTQLAMAVAYLAACFSVMATMTDLMCGSGRPCSASSAFLRLSAVRGSRWSSR